MFKIFSLLSFFFLINNSALGACSSPTSLTTYVALDVLTAAQLNSDNTAIASAVNTVDGSCLTDNTVTEAKLDTSTLGVLLDAVGLGCKISRSDADTISVSICRIGVDGVLTETTGASTVDMACGSCSAETTATDYYLYATTASTTTALDLVILTTTPGVDGYSGTSRVLGKFHNNDDGDIVSGGISQWGINQFIPDHRDNTSFTMVYDATTTAPTKATTTIIDLALWRRVGDSMHITYTYDHTNNTGAASGTGDYIYKLPTGYYIDSTKITVGSGLTRGVVGSFAGDAGGTERMGFMQIQNSTGLAAAIFSSDTSTVVKIGSTTALDLDTADLTHSFSAIVPIKGWGVDL